MITIEVLNAQELATNEAGTFKVWLGSLLGRDIHGMVLDKVRDRVASGLSSNGVDATVLAHEGCIKVWVRGVSGQGWLASVAADFFPGKVEKKVVEKLGDQLAQHGVRCRIRRS